MRKSRNAVFYCFSPAVMALTVVVELALAIYVLFTLRRTRAVQLGVALLVFLALFQIAEYGICEGLGFSGTVWAQIGFAAITMLPVLGTHLIYEIAKKPNKSVITAAYVSGLVWIGLFLFGGIMENQVCSGNYVIFELTEGFGGAYFVFYYFWLIVGSAIALRLAGKATKKRAQALRLMVLGYASFTVPATFIWFVYDGAARGLPSIMCGFAVLFALLLGLAILPRTTNKR